MLYYCKKCGRIILLIIEDNLICDCCKSDIFPIPDKFLIGKSKMIINEELKDQFIEKYVKSSPEFDQYLFDHRDEILAKQSADFNAKMEHGRAILEEQSNIPKCPTCQSANIRKMSGLESGASIAMFGLFSRKINKTFKCNNCGYTW